MIKNSRSNWEKEFAEFAAAEAVPVPTEISETILNKVSSDLHPSGIRVFLKTAALQTVLGFVTLLFCPQFGISLTSSSGIMPYLMKYGDSVCMLGCGAVFTSLSLLAASLLLKPEEVRALKERQVLQLGFLVVLSLFAFMFLGGEVALSVAVAWSLGAIIGGALSLEAGWSVRMHYKRSLA